jgi:DNA modification methylase
VSVRILVGDARAVLATLPAESVHCVVSSPPYWGLRDYQLPPTVWGGDDEGCAHAWGDEITAIQAGGGWAVGNSPDGKKKDFDLGVRSQGTFCAHCNAWRGSLGLEPTPAAYVAHLVEVFRAVRRVLRDDGTCWVNLGDSYASSAAGNSDATFSEKQASNRGNGTRRERSTMAPGLKPKDLVGIPWRVAFALQADGWWLRSEIIWSKPNPMPESVTDRPTKAHEQVFLLAKSERYFYDADAVKEPLSESTLRIHSSSGVQERAGEWKTEHVGNGHAGLGNGPGRLARHAAGRSKRSVWTIASAPFSEAHFATFPPALVEPCVQAGTSARGACPACGAPWRRAVERTPNNDGYPHGPGGMKARDPRGNAASDQSTLATVARYESHTLGWAPTCGCAAGLAPGVVEPCVQAGTSERGCCATCGAPWRRAVAETPDYALFKQAQRERRGAMRSSTMEAFGLTRGSSNPSVTADRLTTGWAPTCACAPDPKPCVVLDPFGGAGTVGLVSDRLRRDAILIELKPEYAAMAERRIREEAPLLTAVEVEGELPAEVERECSERGGKAVRTPRNDGARWSLVNSGVAPRGRDFRPPATSNGHGALAPEQLALVLHQEMP